MKDSSAPPQQSPTQRVLVAWRSIVAEAEGASVCSTEPPTKRGKAMAPEVHA